MGSHKSKLKLWVGCLRGSADITSFTLFMNLWFLNKMHESWLLVAHLRVVNTSVSTLCGESSQLFFFSLEQMTFPEAWSYKVTSRFGTDSRLGHPNQDFLDCLVRGTSGMRGVLFSVRPQREGTSRVIQRQNSEWQSSLFPLSSAEHWAKTDGKKRWRKREKDRAVYGGVVGLGWLAACLGLRTPLFPTGLWLRSS